MSFFSKSLLSAVSGTARLSSGASALVMVAPCLSGAEVAPQAVSAPDSIEGFFENYCYDCHDSLTAKADLNLEDLPRSIADSADALNWQDILDQLNAGEMPPKDKKQPTDEELALVVGDLTESLLEAQGMLRDSGGEIALRRINHR